MYFTFFSPAEFYIRFLTIFSLKVIKYVLGKVHMYMNDI